MNRTNYTNKAKRWVVKIGSALLTKDGAGLDYDAIHAWVSQIAKLRESGIEIVLVSSGSVAEGMSRMGWKTRPNNLSELQAAAAIGQTGLIQAYESEFQKYKIQCAQILLTHDEVSQRKRYLNARNTLHTLLKLNAIPIVNENDTVALEEIRLGDNDTLAALVANIVEADLLVILTDQQGLFDKDPRHNDDAKLISEASANDSKLLNFAGDTKTALGSGGMQTKLIAAQRAANSACATIIASGREKNVLERIYDAEEIGTLLTPSSSQLKAKKQWIAGQVQSLGKVYLDEGATIALLNKHSSLLPIGVINSEGDFKRGDVIDCLDLAGNIIARGVINYNAEEVVKLHQVSSQEIPNILNYSGDQELIHRDNLVIIS